MTTACCDCESHRSGICDVHARYPHCVTAVGRRGIGETVSHGDAWGEVRLTATEWMRLRLYYAVLRAWNFTNAITHDMPDRSQIIPSYWSWKRPRLHRWSMRFGKAVNDAMWRLVRLVEPDRLDC